MIIVKALSPSCSPTTTILHTHVDYLASISNSNSISIQANPIDDNTLNVRPPSRKEQLFLFVRLLPCFLQKPKPKQRPKPKPYDRIDVSKCIVLLFYASDIRIAYTIQCVVLFFLLYLALLHFTSLSFTLLYFPLLYFALLRFLSLF